MKCQIKYGVVQPVVMKDGDACGRHHFVGGQDGCEGRFNFGGHHQDSFVKLLTQLNFTLVFEKLVNFKNV